VERSAPAGDVRTGSARSTALRTGKLVITTGSALAVVGGSLVVTATPAAAATLTVTNTSDAGAGSLRAALAAANDGDVIEFQLPPGSEIVLENGQLEVDDAVSINPAGTDITVRQGDAGYRVFYLYQDSAQPITITGLTITGGNVDGSGGGIFTRATDVVLDDVVVDGNSASSDGGGIWAGGSEGNGTDQLTLVDSRVSGNSAGDDGGGLFLYSTSPYGTSTIDGTTFYDNDAGDEGGGIAVYQTDGDVDIVESTIEYNEASSYGGGVFLYNTYGAVDIDSTTITHNDAGYGGGVSLYGVYGEVSFTNTDITYNYASSRGGGVDIASTYGAAVDFQGGSISHNYADGDGGGLATYHSGVYLSMVGTEISGNYAYGNGGGLSLYELDSPAELRQVTITDNHADSEGGAIGGGIAVIGGTEGLHIVDSTVSGNTADGGGAGIGLYSGGEGDESVLIERTTIGKYNVALQEGSVGGGLLVENWYGDVDVVNSTISGNAAFSGGGVFIEDVNDVQFRHSTIVDNFAFVGGGIKYPGNEVILNGAGPAFVAGPYYYSDVAIDHTIVANNYAGGYGEDLVGPFEVSNSLIGDTSSGFIIDRGGNIFDEDPELGDLDDNGGPTETHLPDEDSPVVDAGEDGDAIAEVPDTDQRGEDRVAGSDIDIGSVELGDQGVVVSVAATTPTAEEGATPGVFTFTRTGSTEAGLTVGYQVSGTATPTDDYAPLGSVMFPAGQSSVTKQVVAVDDATEEPDETVIVTLVEGTGYTVGTPISATVTIIDPGENPELCDPAPEDGFTDVPEGVNVHEAAVDCLAWLGVTEGGPQGLPADQYGPALSVTRGQMASFLARLIERAGVELPAATDDHFDDDDGTTHEDNINRLFEAGIIEGFPDGTYHPGDPVRRDQMASFLLRTYDFISEQELPPGDDAFTDDDGNVHEAAINALQEAGVIQGTATPGIYDPDGNVRRDQMGSFLVRLAELLFDQGEFPAEDPTP
jgi:hypothetical protein